MRHIRYVLTKIANHSQETFEAGNIMWANKGRNSFRTLFGRKAALGRDAMTQDLQISGEELTL